MTSVDLELWAGTGIWYYSDYDKTGNWDIFCLNVNGDLQIKAKPLHGMGEDLHRMAYVLFSFNVEAHNHGKPCNINYVSSFCVLD